MLSMIAPSDFSKVVSSFYCISFFLCCSKMQQRHIKVEILEVSDTKVEKQPVCGMRILSGGDVGQKVF